MSETSPDPAKPGKPKRNGAKRRERVALTRTAQEHADPVAPPSTKPSDPPSNPFSAVWSILPKQLQIPALVVIVAASLAAFVLTHLPDWVKAFKPEEAKKELPSQQFSTNGTNSPIIQGNTGSTFYFGHEPTHEAPARSFDQIRKDILDAIATYRSSSYATDEAARSIFRAKQSVLLHYQFREAQQKETDPLKSMDHTKQVGNSRNAIERERPIIPSIQEIDKLIQFLESNLIELAKKEQFPAHQRSLLESHLKDLAALRAGYSEVITAMLNCDSYWESKYKAIRDCQSWEYGRVFFNVAEFIEKM